MLSKTLQAKRDEMAKRCGCLNNPNPFRDWSNLTKDQVIQELENCFKIGFDVASALAEEEHKNQIKHLQKQNENLKSDIEFLLSKLNGDAPISYRELNELRGKNDGFEKNSSGS